MTLSQPQPPTAQSQSAAQQRGTTVPGQVVLVLQGGGALGSYQAGVYQAMQEAGIEPDWVIGTSIGALNGALIAGNPPELRLPRLRTFWHGLEQTVGAGLVNWGPSALTTALSDWATMTMGIPAFFTPNPLAWLGQQARVGVERAAYYSTAPLRHTLGALLDLDYIEAKHVRLTLGAVRIATGQMRYFDSSIEPISLDSILASGALPPAFPAVRVNNDYYWDGGTYSNTPVEAVLNDSPRRNSLIFTVDLWSGEGRMPESLWQVTGKEKDIRYASRSDSSIKQQRQLHHLRHIIQELAKAMPESLRAQADIAEMASWGCTTVMHIARIIAPHAASTNPLMDIDFTPLHIKTRWQAGYRDAKALIDRAPWNLPVDPVEGIIIHNAMGTL